MHLRKEKIWPMRTEFENDTRVVLEKGTGPTRERRSRSSEKGGAVGLAGETFSSTRIVGAKKKRRKDGL